MAQVINTNVSAINAQRQLNKSGSMMSTAMERLASGLRINSAKDDAAGLAISTRFNTQIRGLNQAVRNANDGISLAQTAEASMQEMTNILQRMRELAVQSANSTNSSSDRASIQSEVDQLFDELDRISDTTQFNGTTLLDGSASGLTFQIGANSGQTLDVSVGSVTTQALSLNASSALGELNTGRVDAHATGVTSDIASGDILINDVELGAVDTNSASAVVTAINAVTPTSGVSAAAYNNVKGLGGTTGVVSGLVINTNTVADTTSMEDLVTKINRDVGGVTASLNSDGSVSLDNDTGDDIVIAGTVTNSGLTAGTYKGYVALTNSSDTAISITLGSNSTASTADLNNLGLNISSGSSTVTSGTVTTDTVALGADITINDVQIGASNSHNAADKAAAINAVSADSGVTADAQTISTFGNLDFSNTVLHSDDATINGVSIDLTTVTNVDDVVTQVNNTSGLQGVVATANATTGELILTSEDGLDIEVDLADGSRAFFGSDVAGSATKLVLYGATDAEVVNFSDHTSDGAVLYIGSNSGEMTAVAMTSDDTTLNALASSIEQHAGVSSATVIDGNLEITGLGGGSDAISFNITAAATAGDLFQNLVAGDTVNVVDNDTVTASVTQGNLTLTSDNNEDILIGGTASDVALLGMVEQGGSSSFAGLGLSVTTLDNATNAITRIDAALDTISTRRGDLGAVQNRLSSTISNLSSISQNLAAANSRIQDADFASETAEMTKAQILQQAGISILAQANAGSQSVLSLLG